jgi:hypothetical protein
MPKPSRARLKYVRLSERFGHCRFAIFLLPFQQDDALYSESTFTSLGVNEKLCKSLETMHLVRPTEVQKRAIPAIMAGGDVMMRSQTGTCRSCRGMISQSRPEYLHGSNALST